MQPQDVNCTSWVAMQEKLADEILRLNQDLYEPFDEPHRDIEDWAYYAHVKQCDYILIVKDINIEEHYPIYCQDFHDMHDKYHQYHQPPLSGVEQIVRVLHDGTFEENIELHNIN